MPKQIAVLTDATSSGFWFPQWYDFYASQFGAKSLFVVTYEGKSREFDTYELGGLIEIKQKYDDTLRARVVSSFGRTLLHAYDFIVRVDVDEFLIADPRKFESLKDYLECLNLSYVTAFGFDVIEAAGESPLVRSEPILVSQRKIAVINSALHKTAITAVSLEWGEGFHGCSSPPHFSDLYLAHMKFADTPNRIIWHEQMLQDVHVTGPEAEYFSVGKKNLRAEQAHASEKPRIDGWNIIDLPQGAVEYLKTVDVQHRSEGFDLYQGKFLQSESAIDIPAEFHGIL